MIHDPKKPIERVTQSDVLGAPSEGREESTIEQWRAASASLKRFNEALTRIGEAEAEAMAGSRRAE